MVRRHTEKVSEVGFLLLPIPFLSAAPILYLLRHTRSFAFRVCTFFYSTVNLDQKVHFMFAPYIRHII